MPRATTSIPGAVKIYQSPADPSLSLNSKSDKTSYVFNPFIFNGSGNLNRINDGTVNTLLFTEKYATCSGSFNVWAGTAQGTTADIRLLIVTAELRDAADDDRLYSQHLADLGGSAAVGAVAV